jgi:hypothetical protein
MNDESGNRNASFRVHRSSFIASLLVPSEGLEPPHPAPEAGTLSAELRGHYASHSIPHHGGRGEADRGIAVQLAHWARHSDEGGISASRDKDERRLATSRKAIYMRIVSPGTLAASGWRIGGAAGYLNIIAATPLQNRMLPRHVGSGLGLAFRPRGSREDPSPRQAL